MNHRIRSRWCRILFRRFLQKVTKQRLSRCHRSVQPLQKIHIWTSEKMENKRTFTEILLSIKMNPITFIINKQQISSNNWTKASSSYPHLKTKTNLKLKCHHKLLISLQPKKVYLLTKKSISYRVCCNRLTSIRSRRTKLIHLDTLHPRVQCHHLLLRDIVITTTSRVNLRYPMETLPVILILTWSLNRSQLKRIT